MMNDIDDSQPYRHEPIYYCTRDLMVLNLSSKAATNRKKRVIDLSGQQIYTYLGAIIVIGALLYYVMGKGLF